jgi:hypothetical protein
VARNGIYDFRVRYHAHDRISVLYNQRSNPVLCHSIRGAHHRLGCQGCDYFGPLMGENGLNAHNRLSPFHTGLLNRFMIAERYARQTVPRLLKEAR